MSNLDPAQGALGIVWCADPIATVSEMKGGQQWNPGNDTTGVGAPDNPYATPEQCLKEIRTFEGQAQTTKMWRILCVTDPLENSTYPRIDRSDSGVTFPEAEFFITIEGWQKDWGITDRGKWLDISHKPTVGGYDNSAGQDAGIRKLLFADMKIVTDEHWHVQLQLAAGSAPRTFFYGCELNRIGSTTLIAIAGGSGSPSTRFMACTFNTGVNSSIGVSNVVDLVNCFINTNTDDALRYDRDTGGGQLARYFRTLNCIFIVDGSGFYVHNNENGGYTQTDTQSAVRSHNRYWLKNGALFAKWSASEPIVPNFVPTPPYDVESSQGDPILAVEGQPILANSSPIFDKGGSLGGVFATNLIDPTGMGLHLRDALGFSWGDTVDANTPVTTGGETRFSHRSIGPIQQPLGYVAGETVQVTPVGIHGISGPFVVGRVGLDEDLTGTCQVQLTQADDDAGTVSVLKIDSAPLHVVASESWIDISEEGGPIVSVQIPLGIYNTLDLHTAIETALNGAGLTGTYTVTYNTTTKLTTISVTGIPTGFVLHWDDGPNAASSIRTLIGFFGVNTPQQLSTDSDSTTDQNFYRTDVTFEYAPDYVEGQDPATSGTWNPMGTDLPSQNPLDEGTAGVRCDIGPRHVRVNVGDVSPTNQKFHGWRGWTGNLKSADVAP